MGFKVFTGTWEFGVNEVVLRKKRELNVLGDGDGALNKQKYLNIYLR